MKQLFKKKFNWLFTLTIAARVVLPFAAFASDADVAAVVDATAPYGAVSLSPEASGNITINLRVTGNQV